MALSPTAEDLSLILNAAENWLQCEEHSAACLTDHVLAMESREVADAIRRVEATLRHHASH